MAFETDAIGKEPLPALALDKERLSVYLQSLLPSVFDGKRDLQVLQLTHGQSNPTYVLKYGDASWVLRKKPSGQLLPSAHQIEREFTVLKALAKTDVPVPNVLHFCKDATIVGTPFYLMEHIKGMVFTDPNLPSLLPHQRQQVYTSIAETLGKLHNVNVSAVGLDQFGTSTRYCERQIYPLVSEEHVVSLRQGNGWADAAYACLPFYVPSAQHLPKVIDAKTQGIPSEQTFMEIYLTARKSEWPSHHDWAFYKALALFRLASICQGVGTRAAQGNASSELAMKLGSPENVSLIANRGLQIAKEQKNASLLRSRRKSAVLLLSELDFAGYTARRHAQDLVKKVAHFMEEHIFPLEPEMEAHLLSSSRWQVFPPLQHLKDLAQREGLWNLFIPPKMADEIRQLDDLSDEEKRILCGPGLTNVEYCFVAELMGRCLWASEVFNCSAPDTGNMEILAQYGTNIQKKTWLVPLLKGEIRSCFAMTEKHVASSDATNIQSRIERRGEIYALSGKKWWTSGAMHPHVKICIFMGKTDVQQPAYRQQSMILVPMDQPGVQIQRPMLQFGYDDAPAGHPEIHFENVKVPLSSVLGKEGQGFEIAQSRLGPGRLHHCMRLIGIGKRALELAKERVHHRVAFGTPLARNASVQMDIGRCAVQLRAARLLVLSAADALDHHGGKYARAQIAAAKAFVPKTVEEIVDRAIQMHGGTGLSNDFPLAQMYTAARSLRIADGPDEVHLSTIGRLELFHSKL